MRRILYSVACSVDGYIAREDHSFDWIPNDQADRLGDFFKTIDTALIGRRTHDLMVKMGQPAFPGLAAIVFSRNPHPPSYPNVRWVAEDAVDFARGLREQPGRSIWLMGGSDLARTFLDAHLVDEISLTVVPILLGSGIPLFPRLVGEIPLRLMDQQTWPSGLIKLRYEMKS